uniref:Secreted protein n=1 Tax=Tetranychus urticae TaxID=32264 RepID=T1KV42_TETUR
MNLFLSLSHSFSFSLFSSLNICASIFSITGSYCRCIHRNLLINWVFRCPKLTHNLSTCYTCQLGPYFLPYTIHYRYLWSLLFHRSLGN